MSSFGNVKAVVIFETKRAISRTRILWWVVLAALPVALTLITLYISELSLTEENSHYLWAGMFFLLCPMATSMLGTFLIASPAISTELERKSWVYFAVRPHATKAILLGKYFVAVLWAASAGITGVTISILLANPPSALSLWGTMVVLILMSCFAYAAAYLLLGTIFYKRAMIAGIVYSFLFEIAASFIPAIVNKLTIQFRLRAIFLNWADIDLNSSDTTVLGMFGDASPTEHIVILVTYTVFLLIVSLVVLRYREFTVADEATT